MRCEAKEEKGGADEKGEEGIRTCPMYPMRTD